MPKSLAWICQEFPSRGISTPWQLFHPFFGRTLDYFKEKSWKENGQFGSNLTDRSTTPRPVACVAGWIVMRGVLCWRRSHDLTSKQSSRGSGAKKQQYPPANPASGARYMSRGQQTEKHRDLPNSNTFVTMLPLEVGRTLASQTVAIWWTCRPILAGIAKLTGIYQI